MPASTLQEVVPENGDLLDQAVIKPADLDLMNDARLQELGSLRFPFADLQARGMSESRQRGDRFTAGPAANALGPANRPQVQDAAVPSNLIVKHNSHRASSRIFQRTADRMRQAPQTAPFFAERDPHRPKTGPN